MAFTVTANLQLNPASLAAARNAASRAFGGGGGARRFTGALNNGLGQITERATEFGKSMNAATARVFAFGATAAVLQGIKQGFSALLSNLVEVEKQLTLIKSTFGNSGNFGAFREDIFKTAQATGTSFKEAAAAALEFARQGLGAEETSKRLRAALTLSQIAGYDTTKSVEVLTAAINGYADAGTDASVIINKLVAVDTNFAVSAKDLSEALFRAGASAGAAGVKFNDFLGFVTAVQQKTARGGAVIGNSLKTIFTRLSDTNVINDLRDLGVAIDSSQNGTEKLNSIAEALGRISDPGIAANIKRLVGSTYQINTVTALLDDLQSKQNSIAGDASSKAANASNEAFQKSAELAKTLSVQINDVVLSYQNLAEKIGQSTLAGPIKTVLGLVSGVGEFLNKALDPDKGLNAMKILFNGIGAFIAGPGLALIAGAFYKIGRLIFGFASQGLKEILQLGSATERFVKVQAEIGALLANDARLYAILTNSAVSRTAKEQAVLDAINRQNASLVAQRDLIASIAAFAGGRGVFNAAPGGGFANRQGRLATFATGYIPASMKMEEAMAVMMGAPANVKAKFGKGRIGGKRFIMNNKELEIPNAGKNGDSAVIPLYASGYTPLGAAVANANATLRQRQGRKIPMPAPATANFNTRANFLPRASQATNPAAPSSIGFGSVMAGSLAASLGSSLFSSSRSETLENQKLSKATKNLEELNAQIEELSKQRTVESEKEAFDLVSKRLELEKEIAGSNLKIQEYQRDASSGWNQAAEVVKQLLIFAVATKLTSKAGGLLGGIGGFSGIGRSAVGSIGGALGGVGLVGVAAIGALAVGAYAYVKAQEKANLEAYKTSKTFAELTQRGIDLSSSINEQIKTTQFSATTAARTGIGGRIADLSSFNQSRDSINNLIDSIQRAINPEARSATYSGGRQGAIALSGSFRNFRENLFSEEFKKVNQDILNAEKERFSIVERSNILQKAFSRETDFVGPDGKLTSVSPRSILARQKSLRESGNEIQIAASQNARNASLETIAAELVDLETKRRGQSVEDFNKAESFRISEMRSLLERMNPEGSATKEILGEIPSILSRLQQEIPQSERTLLTGQLLRESQKKLLSSAAYRVDLGEQKGGDLISQLKESSDYAQGELSKTVESLSSSLDFLRQNVEKQNSLFASSSANLSSFLGKREGLSDLTSKNLRGAFGGKASDAQQNIDLLNTYFQKLTSGVTNQSEIAKIRSSIVSSINPKNAAQSRQELNFTAFKLQKNQAGQINTGLERSLFDEVLKTGFRGIRGAGNIPSLVDERGKFGVSPEKVLEEIFINGSEEVRTQLAFLGESFKQIADIDATGTRESLDEIDKVTKELNNIVPLLKSSLDPIPEIWNEFARQLDTPITSMVSHVVRLDEVSGDLTAKLSQIVTNLDAANIRIASTITTQAGPKPASISEQLPVE